MDQKLHPINSRRVKWLGARREGERAGVSRGAAARRGGGCGGAGDRADSAAAETCAQRPKETGAGTAARSGKRADAVLHKGEADMISFGSTFLANPDLPKRLQLGTELNEPDPATFYSGGEKGYTDYPALIVS